MKTQIKSLQQFNAQVDYFSERYKSLKDELPELHSISCQIDNVPLSVIEEIADYYKLVLGKLNTKSNALYLCLHTDQANVCIHVHSVPVEAVLTYKEA